MGTVSGIWRPSNQYWFSRHYVQGNSNTGNERKRARELYNLASGIHDAIISWWKRGHPNPWQITSLPLAVLCILKPSPISHVYPPLGRLSRPRNAGLSWSAASSIYHEMLTSPNRFACADRNTIPTTIQYLGTGFQSSSQCGFNSSDWIFSGLRLCY